MTKIIYIANARLPTERAHGINIMKTCEALARSGAEVKLLVPRRRNLLAQSAFYFYGVERVFELNYIPALDLRLWKWGSFGFYLNQIAFSLALLFSEELRDREKIVIFTRDEFSGFLLKILGFKVFYDMHGFPESKRFFWKLAMRTMDGIVATNVWKVKRLRDLFGISGKQVLVAPNGFDAKLFDIREGKKELRQKLGLPESKFIALYAGHLYDWKGVDTLARSAPLAPDILFVFVGGTAHETREFGERYRDVPNILLLGYKPYYEIPGYLKAADVLALASSRRSLVPRLAVFSQYDTSPIKLFEYMASGVPIVASDLPSTREIMDETMCVFAEPDNPESFVRAIKRIIDDRKLGGRLAENAKRESAEYTWRKRGEKIMKFIQSVK